ncbi:serine hydrolase [Aliidiomarina sanyensis]|uniref:Serine hydrolase n=1 Tax=Aliidiomarina sanyensis TaxID=1249555 RepID=A0A432WBC5_9GAMM|nr:serine hydrolase [Aliidiomarina sanyensis]
MWQALKQRVPHRHSRSTRLVTRLSVASAVLLGVFSVGLLSVAPSTAQPAKPLLTTGDLRSTYLASTAEHAPVQLKPFSLAPGFDDFFQAQLASDDVPGGVYAVVHRDRVVEINTFGVRARNQAEPITPDTVFRIASVSKTFAGNLASILEQQGYFSMHDSVKHFVPNLDFKNPDYALQLQVEHLLAQSTGVIPNAYDNLIEANYERQQILPHFNRINPMCTPGQCYGYQNVLFSLIEDVIHESTGQTYDDWLQTLIFQPLGMRSASLGYEAYHVAENKAHPHIRGRNGWFTREVTPHYYRYSAAAGVNASALDLSQWLIAQMGYAPSVMPVDVVSKVRERRVRTVRDLRRASWRPYLRNAHYGLGWRIYDFMGHDIVYHGGWVQGFRAEIAYSPEFDVGLVILINAESSAMNALAPEFWRQVLPRMQDEQFVPYLYANGVRENPYLSPGAGSFIADHLPLTPPDLISDLLGTP